MPRFFVRLRRTQNDGEESDFEKFVRSPKNLCLSRHSIAIGATDTGAYLQILTIVPRFTKSNSSTMSRLAIRIQPLEAGVPSRLSAGVPWM